MSLPLSAFNSFFPLHFELETTRILIRGMKMEDEPVLFKLSRAKDIWTYFYKDLSDEKEFRNWFHESLKEKQEGKRMPFVVTDKDTGEICGSSSYGNISFFDKRIEIGWSWLSPDYIGMGVNK